jgi:N-acetylglucosaminyldiphosphoundecaprenol N-acetyl-beta-D-mannosaminyltransferase
MHDDEKRGMMLGEKSSGEGEGRVTAGGTGWHRVAALDIDLTPLNAREAAGFATTASGKRLLLNHNLHSAYLHEIDSKFRQLYQLADRVVIDGAPILWLTSLFSRRRLTNAERISSTDWIDALPGLATSRRLFVYGAVSRSNEMAVTKLSEQLKDWSVSGVDGFVDESTAVRLIQDFKPDIVLVGLGMPRQEHFLLGNYAQLPDATYATVGGAIDYIAGVTRLAPRWLGRLGLEWVWRLVNEPRRLAYRYLIEPLLLAYRVMVRALMRRDVV